VKVKKHTSIISIFIPTF